MATLVLTRERADALATLTGTRGAIGPLVAKAALLAKSATPGVPCVDVLAEVPALREAISEKSGNLVYGDSDGNFDLGKLANAVKGTIDRKMAKAALDGHAMPDLAMLRDDDADTVFIVNWSQENTTNGATPTDAA